MKIFLGNKNITNIYKIQTYHLIICGYFCIRFIGFNQKGKILLDYTDLFFPKKNEENDKIILKCFQ